MYSKLKYESGVHRVQRVPQTETQGRVHTSTATARLPSAWQPVLDRGTSVDTVGGMHCVHSTMRCDGSSTWCSKQSLAIVSSKWTSHVLASLLAGLAQVLAKLAACLDY